VIALDTNVLVRYLVQDDAAQARVATNVIESLTDRAQGFVGREVLIVCGVSVPLISRVFVG